MTELTFFSIEEAAKLPRALCEKAFPARMKRADRFLREEDSLRCIAAGALLAGVLGLREEDLREGTFHKPFSPASRVKFNLSHSGRFVLLATDEEEVGVDVEKLDPAHLSLAKTVFVPEELDWMEEDPLSRFFVLWTLKESVMKQCGQGFHLPPKSFSVLPLTCGESVSLFGKSLFAKTQEQEGHLFSVCTQHPIETVSVRSFSAEQFRATQEERSSGNTTTSF